MTVKPLVITLRAMVWRKRSADLSHTSLSLSSLSAREERKEIKAAAEMIKCLGQQRNGLRKAAVSCEEGTIPR